MFVTPGSTQTRWFVEVDLEDRASSARSRSARRPRPAARRRRGPSPSRARPTARPASRARPHARADLLGACPGAPRPPGSARVLQQPVGLVRAQLVLLRVAPALADDLAQPPTQLRRVSDGTRLLDDHPREDRRGLQVDEHAHDQHQHEAPAEHAPEQLALAARRARPPRRRSRGSAARSSCPSTPPEEFAAASSVGSSPASLAADTCSAPNSEFELRVRAGDGDAEPADDRRQEREDPARARDPQAERDRLRRRSSSRRRARAPSRPSASPT